MPRDKLDVEMLAAEDEVVMGLPPPPYPFPVPQFADLGTFKLRRVETMCSAHQALLSDITQRLMALKNRPSADPENDPLIRQLAEQVQALGRAPRRAPATDAERQEALNRATDRVLAGDVSR